MEINQCAEVELSSEGKQLAVAASGARLDALAVLELKGSPDQTRGTVMRD